MMHGSRSVQNRTARPRQPLRGRVGVPGAGVPGAAALLLAALAVGESRLEGLAGDAGLADALRALGAGVVQDGAAWRVTGRGVGGLAEPAGVLRVADAGAAVLLAGVLASHDLYAVLEAPEFSDAAGEALAAVLPVLGETGASILAREGGVPPLAIRGARVAMPLAIRGALPPLARAAAMLAGLGARGETVLDDAPAEAPTDAIEALLVAFGARLRITLPDHARSGPGRGGLVRSVAIGGQPELRAPSLRLPGAVASAAWPLGAALLVPGSEVTVRDVAPAPALLEALRALGAGVRQRDGAAGAVLAAGDVVARHAPLHGAALAMGPVMEHAPMLAVLAACATGITRLAGLAVGGEARMAAVAALLSENGARVATEGGDLLVHGDGSPPAGGGEAPAMAEMQMAGLLLGQVTAAPVLLGVLDAAEAAYPGVIGVLAALGCGWDETERTA